ncbi:hypothetical protein MHYP_G00146270 [Metynnis hypsauchen]
MEKRPIKAELTPEKLWLHSEEGRRPVETDGLHISHTCGCTSCSVPQKDRNINQSLQIQQERSSGDKGQDSREK